MSIERERDPIFLLEGEALTSLLEEAIEMAIYDADPLQRDEGRSILIKRAQKAQILALIAFLDAEHKQTRQRAVRLLSEMQGKQVLPLLDKWYQAQPSARALQNAARIWATLTDGHSTMLAKLLTHEEPSVRRSAVCHALTDSALDLGLQDLDMEVVEKTALQFLRRGKLANPQALEKAIQQHPQLDLLKNLQGQSNPCHPSLIALAQKKDKIALSYLGDLTVIMSSLTAQLQQQTPDIEALESLSWAFGRNLSRLDENHEQAQSLCESLATHQLPKLRSAMAKFLPMTHPALTKLAQDTNAGVKWLAQQNVRGAFDAHLLQERLKPHARLSLPSAKPPYGLRPQDELPSLQRVKAALALCHTRFDVNVGVAMRSAEAAGLEALYLMGQPAKGLSSARGAELAVPAYQVPDPSALIDEARMKGYQIVAVQQCPKSIPYHLADYPPNPIFVLGAEDDGIPVKLLEAADIVVEIPLYGAIDSLNVSTAATCVLMHWRMQVSLSSENESTVAQK